MILHPIIDLLKRIVIALPDYAGGGGDSKDVNAVAEGTWWPTRVVIDTATTIKTRSLNNMYGTEKLFVGDQVATLGTYLVNNNEDLKIIVWLADANMAALFIYNIALTVCDLFTKTIPAIVILGWQHDPVLKTIILRQTSAINTLPNINCFNDTPFASNGTGGTIYIPKALYDHLGDGTALDYKSATNWSTIDGYGTITWAQIEGSYYETHYADGTVIE